MFAKINNFPQLLLELLNLYLSSKYSTPLLEVLTTVLQVYGFDQQRLIWYVFRLWDMVFGSRFER